VEYLLGPTRTLVLAALLLVTVGSLPAVSAPAQWKTRALALVYALAVAAGAGLVWFGLDRGAVLVNAYPAKIERYAAIELSKAKEPNVVVIDGGSYVLNGVDAPTVAEELATLGYAAHVVRLAAGGANHFERYRMQQGVVQRVHGKQSPDQRSPSSKTTWIPSARSNTRRRRIRGRRRARSAAPASPCRSTAPGAGRSSATR